jgi:hypothetical protein
MQQAGASVPRRRVGKSDDLQGEGDVTILDSVVIEQFGYSHIGRTLWLFTISHRLQRLETIAATIVLSIAYSFVDGRNVGTNSATLSGRTNHRRTAVAISELR